jgi:hypothetical protein
MDAIVLPPAAGSPLAQQPGGDFRFGVATPATVVGGAAAGFAHSLLLLGVGGGMLLAALVLGYVFIANQRRSAATMVAEAPDGITGFQTESSNPETAPLSSAVAPRSAPAPVSAANQTTLSPPPPPPAAPASQRTEVPPATLPPMRDQPPQVTRAEAEALILSLERAKTALGEQNFDVADQELATAGALAKWSKHQEAVARLKEVSGYVKQFRQAVAAAIEGQ